MKDIKAKIISNKNIAKDYFKMVLEAPYIAKKALPGQFVEIKCSDSFEPLLRRPFSVHRVTDHGSQSTDIEILYETIGKGTDMLAKKKAGEYVSVLGPLGNGFTLPQSTINYKLSTILIAGGIGVAPLMYLAESLASKKIKPIVLLGARSKDFILCEEDFKKLGLEVSIATDNGSKGFRGYITDLLEKTLSTINHQLSTIYACGPVPMLKRVSEICNKNNIECQVSMEERMACGFGVCLGCAIKTKKNDLKLVCKDGPIFKASELVWE